jgi:pilin isopeptide linkage protein
MFVSISLSGTQAWIDFSQHKTNESKGKKAQATVSVVLSKYERDASGAATQIPIPGATFTLYRVVSGVRTELSSYTTDSAGKISVSGLPAGSYVFVETNPSFGYGYDTDGSGGEIREYPFTLTEGQHGVIPTAHITAYNKRLTTALTITKTVANADDSEVTEEQSQLEFEFTVTFVGGGAYPYTIGGGETLQITSGGKIYLKHRQTATITGLPIGTQYTVTETPVTDYVTTGSGHHGNIPESGASAEFTNTYTPGEEPGETRLIVRKVVTGEPPDMNKQFRFVITIDGVETPFWLKHGESREFILQIGSVYDVREDDYFGDGYVGSITTGSGTAGTAVIEIIQTNRYTGPVNVTISGEKTWDAPDYATLPTSITVLLKNGDTTVQTAVVTPGADGKWRYTFTAPKYEADGVTPIVYTVSEAPIPGFRPIVTGYDIKNTFIPPAVAIVPAVRKVITGAGANPGTVFHFTLTPIGDIPMPGGTVNGVKTVAVTGAGTASFGSISYTQAGTYVYKIAEVNTGEAYYTYDTTVYTYTVTVAESGGVPVIASETVDPGGEIVFTNSYWVPQNDYTSVRVTKVWSDDGDHPATVTVNLYRNGVSQGAAVTLSAANNWTYTWTGLDRFATWTVDEPTVPDGYTKAIIGTATTGFIITNTRSGAPTPETVIIAGIKTWIHHDNPVENQPESITVYILNGSYVVRQRVITASDNWSWSFELPKYDANGNEITYTVNESAVPGYIKTINGYNLQNEHDDTDVPDDNVPGDPFPHEPDGPGKPNVPKTGDNSEPLMWAALLAVSAAAIAVIVIVQLVRRHREKKGSK